MILDSAGNLYGTTPLGGTSAAGAVFKLDSANVEIVLYNFSGGADGGTPYGRMSRDSAGNLYGAANQGGTLGLGVIYEIENAVAP